MLGKTSVSMMVLLVAASLIGISSIHQYIEGQTPTPTPTPQPGQLPTKFVDVKGRLQFVIMHAGGSCNAYVSVSGEGRSQLGLTGGTLIRLAAADHNICTSFGLAKMGGTNITFDAQKIQPGTGAQMSFSATRVLI